MHKVFVYGTLKKGFANHYIIERSGGVFLGNAQVANFSMYRFCVWFPACIPDKGEQIQGEVYQVDSMEYLDLLEGYSGSSDGCLYDREEVETPFGSAWIYFMPPSQVRGKEKITSGQWQ